MDKNKNPLISILMPTYNYGEFIKEAIDSVLEQDFVDFELIISDNASTDNTEEIVSQYLSDDRVVYSRNSENLGMLGNVIKIISLAKGEYCAALCSDDYFLPKHLGRLAHVVVSRPDVDFVYSNVFYANETGSIISINEHFGLKDFNYVGLRNEFANILACGLHIKAQSSIFRTTLYQAYISKLGKDSMEDFTAFDADMFLEFASSGKLFAYINSVTSVHRKHGKQATGHSTYHKGRHLKDNLILWEKHITDETAHLLGGYEEQFLKFVQFNLDLLKQHPEEEKKLLPLLQERIVNVIRRVQKYAEINRERPLSGSPLVTVIMPTKNRPELLQYALSSIKQQTYINWQVIVVNDGGCDVGPLIEKIDAGEGKINYIDLPASRGHAAARNVGLEFSQGEVIAYLDDDDMYLPNHLEIVVDALTHYDEPVVFTQGEWVEENVENGERFDLKKDYRYLNVEHNINRLLVQNYIGLIFLAHRKSCLIKAKGFDETLTALVDWDLVLSLASHFPLRRLSEVTVQARSRSNVSDNVSRLERKNFPELFRNIYLKYPCDDALVRQYRESFLAGLEKERNEKTGASVAIDCVNESKKNSEIAVILHLYYYDLWDEFKQALLGISKEFDLYISIPKSSENDISGEIIQAFPNANIYKLPNKGRDILPFLTIFKEIHPLNYKLILKLHTKKSPHLKGYKGIADYGEKWRKTTLCSLALWKKRVNDIFDLFNSNPTLGIFSPFSHLYPFKSTDANYQTINQLMPGIDREEFDKKQFSYAGGSMFWFRPEAIEGVLKLNLTAKDFEEESSQLDGTVAHAIERLFGVLCQTSGYILTDRMPKRDDVVYQDWLDTKRENDLSKDKLFLTDDSKNLLKVHCLIYVDDEDLSKLADTIDSMGSQSYENWHLSVISCFSCPDEMFNEVSQLSWLQIEQQTDVQSTLLILGIKSDWLFFLEAGDYLESHAISSCIAYCNEYSELQLVYTDEDRISPEGFFHSPQFKPGFNLDFLYSTDYIGGITLFRTATLNQLEQIVFPNPFITYDLVLHYLDCFDESVIGHIESILLHRREDLDQYKLAQLEFRKEALANHFQRKNIEAVIDEGLVEGTFFVKHQHKEEPKVSIIIPTKDQLPLLKACVDSIVDKTDYPNYEVIIIDNQSVEAETLGYFKALQQNNVSKVRVIEYAKRYNFSAINNFAVEQATGDYLVLLNNDTMVLQAEWLQGMLSQAQREDVGVVGVKLVFPDKTIQHAGVVLGMGGNGVAEHLHIGIAMENSGYMDRTMVVQDYSAVTAACLMIEKKLYLQVGGLDEEKFRILYNDVDLCLKVREQGYKIVWTSYVTLIHHGSSSLKKVKQDKKKIEQSQQEVDNMLEKWLPQLATDPAYNCNLSLKTSDFQVDTSMNVTWNADFKDKPRIYAFPLNSQGVGQYRVRGPLHGLTQAGMVESSLANNNDRLVFPTPVEIERIKPDVLLIQNGFLDFMLTPWKRYKKFNNAFMVCGLDDLVYMLPHKHPKQGLWPKNLRRKVKELFQHSDRLVVANDALAEEFSKMTDEIVVVPNYLENARWDSLNLPAKQITKKLRVGWAGGQEHVSDLEFILPVVEALHKEVDWVFMGLCIDELKPFVKEIHGGVEFDLYPQKLANLNLDLAIAPLGHNKFNECKTNLRLLEYGILAWPVVCSDILPYQGAPVTRVANNVEHWVKVLREKISEPDELRKEGELLQQWVVGNYMLEDHLDEWLTALVP